MAQRICDFIGIDYNERMLEGYKGTRQYDRDQIDPSVATKSIPDTRIDQFYPEAFEVYNKLTGRTNARLRDIDAVA